MSVDRSFDLVQAFGGFQGIMTDKDRKFILSESQNCFIDPEKDGIFHKLEKGKMTAQEREDLEEAHEKLLQKHLAVSRKWLKTVDIKE